MFTLLHSFTKIDPGRLDVLQAVFQATEDIPDSSTWVRYNDRVSKHFELWDVEEVLFGPVIEEESFKLRVKTRLYAKFEKELKERVEQMSSVQYLDTRFCSNFAYSLVFTLSLKLSSSITGPKRISFTSQSSKCLLTLSL